MAFADGLAVGRWLNSARERFRRKVESRDYAEAPRRRHYRRYVVIAAVAIAALYYPLGMFLVQKINDDVTYQAPDRYLPKGGSHAVAITAAVVEREVNRTVWVPNSPWFLPSSLLDNMPNYQMGLLYALSRFTMELTDTLGRTRGTSQVDPDLDRASGLLKYDGTIWVWEPSTSLMPTASAEKQYRAGAKALMRFNDRLSRGDAVYDRRADNLISLLDRIAADLGSQSAALDRQAMDHSAGCFDTAADDIFFATKGRLYGYYMVLRETAADFADLIDEKRLGPVWTQMLDSFRIGAEMDPLIVCNGRNDGVLAPSHLAVQGFYLLRARTRLQEVANVLAK